MYAENVEKMSNEDPEMKSFAPIAREEFCSKKEETLESNVLLDNCFFVIESKIKWHFSFHSITFYCFLLDIFNWLSYVVSSVVCGNILPIIYICNLKF